jgi:tetratricopeptide (TPR) repeat protein
MNEREILDSWKEISAFLKRGVRTCQTWEARYALPVHRLDGSPKARVFAYKDELMDWLEKKSRERERRRKRVLAAVTAGPVLAIAGFVAWRIAVRPPALSWPRGMPALAVLSFENRSGDAKLDRWRDGLAELLIEDLSQSKHIRVVSGEEVYATVKRLGLANADRLSSDDVARVAARTRATHILRGSFFKAGEAFVITANLLKPGANKSPLSLRLEAADERDIIVKVDELTRRVKEGLDLPQGQRAGDVEKEAGTITTSSPDALKFYIEGRRYLLDVDLEQANASFEKAIEIDPGFAMAYRCLAMGRGGAYAKKALELSSRLPEYERLTCEHQWRLSQGDAVGAIDICRRLVRLYPGYTMGYASLAWLYKTYGKVDKAVELYEFILRYQRTAMSTERLADCYMRLGSYQKAEDLCRSFLREVEDNAVVRNFLSASYLYRRQFESALSEAERAYLLRPDSKERIGDIFLLKGDLGKAEDAYQQVVLKDRPTGRRGLYRLALIRGRFDEAIALTRQNMEEAGGIVNRAAYGQVGTFGTIPGALERAGRYREALQALDLYLKAAGEFRSRPANALIPYWFPDQVDDLFAKGRIQAETGSFDEALATAQELKKLIDRGVSPQNDQPACDYILGRIAYGRGDLKRAIESLERACRPAKTDEGDALFIDALARAHFDSGDVDKARREYERITLQTFGRLAYGDLYARAFYRLGRIAERKGDQGEARQRYRRFLDLWKDADAGLAEVEDARLRLAALGGR